MWPEVLGSTDGAEFKRIEGNPGSSPTQAKTEEEGRLSAEAASSGKAFVKLLNSSCSPMISLAEECAGA